MEHAAQQCKYLVAPLISYFHIKTVRSSERVPLYSFYCKISAIITAVDQAIHQILGIPAYLWADIRSTTGITTLLWANLYKNILNPHAIIVHCKIIVSIIP